MEDLTEPTKPKVNTSWILLLALVLVGIAAYWFILRPGQIREECYGYAYSTPNLGDTQEWKQATQYYYEACLRRKGL